MAEGIIHKLKKRTETEEKKMMGNQPLPRGKELSPHTSSRERKYLNASEAPMSEVEAARKRLERNKKK